MPVTFAWDPDKAASNRRKHRIDFADAAGVFEDSRALTRDEPHPGELRHVTMGLDFLGRVFVVCWTAVRTQSASFRPEGPLPPSVGST
jgi:uncharacterized protein